LTLFVLTVSGDEEHERRLVARARRGDRQAFGELMRSFLPGVYRLCRRMGLSHDEADDMTQESFVKAYQAIGRFEEGKPFWNWIARIASNTTINYLKRKSREVTGEDGEMLVGQQSTQAVGSNPHDTIVTQQMETRLEQALHKLPFEYRIVYILRMHLDFDYGRIAETLEIPVGTVMSRLSRARERLVEDLKDLLEP
jgi:RNA polymerase sigma-70 factor (ECF subfamily)